MQPIELLARHSFPPNRLHYCGGNDYSQKIKLFVANKSPVLANELRTDYTTFQSAYNYLCAIADANKLDPFDPLVVEAYWIGNQLLENVSRKQIADLYTTKFSNEQNLGKELASEFAANLPPTVIPHHSFHVLYLHFMTRQLKATLQNLENCLILPCQVADASHSSLVVHAPSLEHGEKGYFISSGKLKKIEKPFPDHIRIGDWVSMHWNTYCMKLSTDQKQRLEQYTQKNIEIVNSLASFSDAFLPVR